MQQQWPLQNWKLLAKLVQSEVPATDMFDILHFELFSKEGGAVWALLVRIGSVFNKQSTQFTHTNYS